MIGVEQSSEVWHFRVRARGARRVYLVTETEDGSRQTSPMERGNFGHWELERELPADRRHSFRCFASDGNVLTQDGLSTLRAERRGAGHHQRDDWE